jgi:hypothetical protein
MYRSSVLLQQKPLLDQLSAGILDSLDESKVA